MGGRHTLKRKKLHGYKTLEGGAGFGRAILRGTDFKAVEAAPRSSIAVQKGAFDVLNRARRRVAATEATVKKVGIQEVALARLGQEGRSSHLKGQGEIFKSRLAKISAQIRAAMGSIQPPGEIAMPPNPTDFQRGQAIQRRNVIRELEGVQAEKAVQETGAKQKVSQEIQKEIEQGIRPLPNILKTPVKASPEIVRQKMQELQRQALREAEARGQSKMNALAAQRAASEAKAGQKAVNQGQIQLQAENYNRVVELVNQVGQEMQTTITGIRKNMPGILTKLKSLSLSPQHCHRHRQPWPRFCVHRAGRNQRAAIHCPD